MIRHIHSKEPVEIQRISRCCETCIHSGEMPDGCGECRILFYDDIDGVERPFVGAAQVCKFWESCKS